MSTASTSVSKTESPGSNPGAPARKLWKMLLNKRFGFLIFKVNAILKVA